ncbi:HAMP domain-containing protein [Streptomyces sp. NPDC059850]|uniref:HAMP domain-containing protein n=1 Tax=Streptomyces sp. NPDC059850 TaxID=3346970 RepID=UPI00364DAA24
MEFYQRLVDERAGKDIVVLRSATWLSVYRGNATDLPAVAGDQAPRVRDTVEQQLTGDVFLACLSPNGRVLRVIHPAARSAPALPLLDAPGQHGRSVVVGGSLAQVNATIRQLGIRVLVIDSVVLALLDVAGWFAVRAGLRPLRRIETTAATIADGDLSSRVLEREAARLVAPCPSPVAAAAPFRILLPQHH